MRLPVSENIIIIGSSVILIFFCVGHICIGMSLQSTCIWTISQWHMDIPEGCVSKTDWYGRWANRDSSKKADRLLKFYGRSANDKNWNVLPGIMALISIIRMVRRDITWIRRYTSLRRKFRVSIQNQTKMRMTLRQENRPLMMSKMHYLQIDRNIPCSGSSLVMPEERQMFMKS